ncbi:MAG: hypothetical protein GXP62_20885 [Oligoflexia bacterium]|nr:hypothetical protein [Oligoflexia bacterium]
MTVVLASVLTMVLLACGSQPFARHVAMGEACDESTQCKQDGTCLSGVCEGYACKVDEDCDQGHVCADIAGVSACAIPCVDTQDCAGTQTCVEEDTDWYCL